MVRLASFLADSARLIYERIAGYLGDRLEGPVEFLAGVPWEERHRRLDAGEIDRAFICGLPYTWKSDRADRPIELLCAPVMAASRYGGQPIYFTDVVVRREHPARSFMDLRGRSWAYSDEGSHSGYNVIRDHLLALGETRGYFGRVFGSGSQQCSIQMVLDGEVDASGIDSTYFGLGAYAGAFVFYGQLDRQITPEQLGWLFSAKLVVATIIGGTQWFLGPVVGAAVFVLLQHVANWFALSHGLVLGGLLLTVVFACPGGIVEATARGLGWAARPDRPWIRPAAS